MKRLFNYFCPQNTFSEIDPKSTLSSFLGIELSDLKPIKNNVADLIKNQEVQKFIDDFKNDHHLICQKTEQMTKEIFLKMPDPVNGINTLYKNFDQMDYLEKNINNFFQMQKPIPKQYIESVEKITHSPSPSFYKSLQDLQDLAKPTRTLSGLITTSILIAEELLQKHVKDLTPSQKETLKQTYYDTMSYYYNEKGTHENTPYSDILNGYEKIRNSFIYAMNQDTFTTAHDTAMHSELTLPLLAKKYYDFVEEQKSTLEKNGTALLKKIKKYQEAYLTKPMLKSKNVFKDNKRTP